MEKDGDYEEFWIPGWNCTFSFHDDLCALGLVVSLERVEKVNDCCRRTNVFRPLAGIMGKDGDSRKSTKDFSLTENFVEKSEPDVI